MISRRLLLLAAVLLAALAGPAAATAKPVKWVTYSAVLEATGDYAATDTDPAVNRSARWTWTTTFPSVVFEGDRAHTTGAANSPTQTSGFLVSAFSSRQLGSEVAQCTPTQLAGPPSPGRFLDAPHTPNADPVLRLRLLTSAMPDFDGCPGQAATSFGLQGTIVDGAYTYDTAFTFPREAIGMGKVVQLVDERVTGRLCPGNPHGGMATCTLDVEGKVTFVKTGEWIADDGTPAEPKPAPPAPPAPKDEGLTVDDIPTPPKPKTGDAVPTLDDVFIPLPPARLAPSGASLTVPVGCRTACRGTVTATALRRGAKARAAAARVLASARFSAPAGRSTRVTLRFSKTARRAVRRAGGVRVTVTTTAPRAARRTLTVRVRR